MSSQRSVAPRRARPVFEGPTYMAPQYHSRLWPRLMFLLLVLLLVGLIGGGGGVYWELHRSQSSSARSLSFRVGNGDSVSTIASRLQSGGVINSSLLFKLDARLQNLSGKLKPGSYSFRRNMSIDQMVGVLSVYKPVYVSIVLPEGYRIGQMAATLRRSGIETRTFLQQASNPNLRYLAAPILNDKPARANLEGYLFPDTYDVQPHSSGQAFARQMVQQLNKEFTPAMLAAIHHQKRTVFQVLTLASIVEREARVASERPLIAGVYGNRLRIGMPLQADPTVQYAAGQAGKWWPQLTQTAATVDPKSPYNTYTHKGLPPGPIANPGLSSIMAAIYPKSTPYLFFVAIPHSHGHHAFARTYQEQLANESKYGY